MKKLTKTDAQAFAVLLVILVCGILLLKWYESEIPDVEPTTTTSVYVPGGITSS